MKLHSRKQLQNKLNSLNIIIIVSLMGTNVLDKQK